MALVPYEGSDISDSEEENDTNETSNLNSTKTNNLFLNDQNEINQGNSTFINLPKPKNNFADLPEETDDEFLHKKEKPTETVPKGKKSIKITIPTISQNEDDADVPIKRFRTASTKATGLFSILPPPRGGRATLIVPQSVKRATKPQTPLIPRTIKPTVTTKPNILETEDDENEDEDTAADFFSLDKINEPIPEIPESKDSEESILRPVMYPERPPESEPVEPIETVDLNDEAFQTLCGPRGKRRGEVSAEILEVQDTDIRPSNKEWLQKALLTGTGEDMEAAAAAAKAVPGGILKRKHQITYLAEQAKANEQQLKAMWAQNRATRQQTQSKYGF